MMTSTKDIAIYFAYALEDQAMQKRLERQLSGLQRRYQVTWWHKYLVDAGHERRSEIEAHLQRAAIILLLVSPDFLHSDECYDLEMAMSLQRHDAGEARVIPILLRPTPGLKEYPFEKLQMLPRNNKPVDTWPKQDQAYKEIAEEIGDSIKTLQVEPPRQSGLLRTRSLVPVLPPVVQQRSKVVQQLYTRLTRADVTALVLTGLGGAGKTTLAKLVYYYAKKQFEAGKGPFGGEPIWLEIQSSFTMADLIARMCDALGTSRPNFSNLLPQEQAELLFDVLKETPRFVILDQFEHLLNAQTRQLGAEQAGSGAHYWLDLLNNSLSSCRVLITSNLKPDIIGYPHGHVQVFPLPDLNRAEGVAFLKDSLRISGMKPSDVELQAATERCQGHPLSLVLLASLINDDSVPNLSALLNDQRYWKGAIALKLLNTIYQTQLDQRQRHLLLAFSIFREAVPLEAAETIMELFTEVPLSFEQLSPVLNALRQRSLLQAAGSLRFQLHPIVASYARDHFDEQSEQANHKVLLGAYAKAAEFCQQQAKKTGPPREQRKSLLDFHDFVEAVWYWCQAERQDAAYEWICQEGLFAGLQRCGGNLTLFELYRTLLPSATWQPEPLQAAQMYNEFGEIQRTLGQKREAQSTFTQALSLFQELGNLEGQVKALNNLGAVYRNLGLLEQATNCYQQALYLCAHMKTPYLHGKATALNNMGVISLYLEQKERALQYFEQALPIQHIIKDQGEVARTLMNIGKVYDIQKKSDKAHEKYLEALPLFQEIGDREGEARVYNHLGEYLRKQSSKSEPEKKRERRQKAWELYTKALRIFREIGDREQEAITLQHLGRFLFFQELENDSRTKEAFEETLAFFLAVSQIFRELQLPEKGEIPEVVIGELQSRLSAERLAALMVSIEVRVGKIVERVLQRGYLI